MKKYFFVFFATFLALSCTNSVAEKENLDPSTAFGVSIKKSDELSKVEFRKQLFLEKELECIISGTIVSVCETEECDFRITLFDGRDILVKTGTLNLPDLKEHIDKNVFLFGKAVQPPSASDLVLFHASGVEIE